MSAQGEMRRLLDRQRAAFEDEGHVSAATRIDRLNRALALVHDNEGAIVSAIDRDFGKRSSHQSRMGDIYATLEALRHARDHVKRWMKPEKRSAGFPLGLFGAKARVEYQPKGVIGIIGTWNFPVNTVFAPLAGVLAAGNRATLKLAERAPNIASLLCSLVAKAFDATEVTCVEGGPEISAAFCSLPFDHLVFTGSTAVGKAVMRAAAENLVPVTLELGGKSPVIIAPDANVAEAAVRIMTGKALNSGQACLAPDYVMLPETELEAFVQHAIAWTRTMFPSIQTNDDFTAVIDARHHQRLRAYLDEARAHGADVRVINPASEEAAGPEGPHKLAFTLVVNPSDALSVMQEEIFGPILVIKTYRAIDECIRFINDRPRPLGLYLFSDDAATQRRVIDHTRSGGVTINDVLTHASIETLPFGGIGPSGMGCYHGLEGWKTFSHARSVYTQSPINLQRLAGMVPPYGAACEKNLKRMIRK